MAYGLASIVILLDNDAADSTLLAGADTFFNAIGGAGSSNALQLRYTGELPLFPSIASVPFSCATLLTRQPPLSDVPIVQSASMQQQEYVDVRGAGFTSSLDGLWCRVGTFGPLLGEWISPTRALCPVSMSAQANTPIQVRVGNTADDWSASYAEFTMQGTHISHAELKK